MKLILNIGIRLVIYVGILFPLLKNIIPGDNVFTTIVAVVVLLIVGSILELRKIMSKLIDKILSIFGKSVAEASKGSDITGAIASSIAPVETVQECPNCGAQIKLSNGRGSCSSCGTAV